MAISNNNTGIRTGVCTSTTRPTAPYEGQHIYETDTDIEYVWNGTAWVVNYVSAASPAFTGVPTAPTAADGTNTTQLATTAFANAAGGLVYITSATIGTAVSSVTVSSCFSSTYDNYVVTIANPVFSVTAGTIGFTFNGLTSGYYGSQSYDLYTGGNNGYNRMNNATNFYVGITATDNASAAVITLYAPNKSLYHMFTSSFYGSGYTGIASGQTVDQTARTGFVITPSSGTITGGTITVYGYRK